MTILEAVLLAILADTPNAPVKPPAPVAAPSLAGLAGPDLARAIKRDLESIAGTGSVDVRIEKETNFYLRISMPSLRPEACARIYRREMELSGLFPNLNFDFRFAAPELANAIKSDIELISGRGTVDVSIDSGTLFNVRIAIPSFKSKLYGELYDRELELYRVFPDLSFDFYLRLQEPEQSADARAPAQ